MFVSHAGLDEVVPGGFGVTVFFFLSGYLITTLLRQEYELTRTISLSRFYLRRAYRIIPPLYIVLLLLLMPIGNSHGNADVSHGAIVAQFLQFTNYYVLIWGSKHLIPDSLPTWSLAVEEHFYLLFPLLLYALLRATSYGRIALVLGALCLTTLLWRCWLVYGLHVDFNYTYLASDSRIDSILFGCVMGVWLNPALDGQLTGVTSARWLLVIAASIALLLFSFLYRSEGFRETLRYSVQGVALLPLFFTAIRKSTWPIYRWLQARPARFLGLISYTFYLIHLRALEVVSKYVGGSRLLVGILGFAVAVAFASAMYYLVERHLALVRRRLHSLLPAGKCAPISLSSATAKASMES